MIIYDNSVIPNYHDYGIMLPIARDRGKQVLDFINKNNILKNKKFVLDFLSVKKSLIQAAPDVLCENSDRLSITRKDMERIHSKKYVDDLFGDGLCAALLNAFELIDADGNPCRYEPDRASKPLNDLFRLLIAQAEGTYLACLLSLLRGGFCFYLGGGMHHARYDKGSGFCLVNDVAAAAFKIAFDMPLCGYLCCKNRDFSGSPLIWIIDLDAHKGDGTAELIRFARERGELISPDYNYAKENSPNKPCILSLSVHMAKGWPLDNESILTAEEGRAPLLPSDVDIGIDSSEEGEYTMRLAEGIKKLENLSADIYGQRRNPDFVLVVDGADPYEHDALPSTSLLRLTLEQCVERDIFVYRYLCEREIPSAWIQSGGYGERAWEPPAHFLTNIFGK
ncbi:MAG: hypothetical protein FWB73_01070 [Treponema sp.]|nr:hypothetical protein [Treponema sp.]